MLDLNLLKLLQQLTHTHTPWAYTLAGALQFLFTCAIARSAASAAPAGAAMLRASSKCTAHQEGEREKLMKDENEMQVSSCQMLLPDTVGISEGQAGHLHGCCLALVSGHEVQKLLQLDLQ